MLATERRQRIMQEMHEHKVVVIVELAEKLGVTPMTIRRDLNLLEQQGLVEKSYGGAVLIESSIKENPYLTRKQVKNPEKRMIAQAAADLVEPSMSIYLDAGTTSYELAALLVEKEYQQLTIVTNDLLIAHMVSQNSNYQVIMLGGVIENANGLTCGYLAKEMIKNIHFDICFVGTQAINTSMYVMTANIDKVELKQLYLKNSHMKVLLADDSKFGKYKLHNICSVGEFDLVISDRKFTEQEQEYFHDSKVRIINI